MRVAVGSLLLTLVLAAGVPVTAQPHADVTDAWSDPLDREFDFWVGEWDVNLRMIQDDLTWKDSVRARASIFRILDGRAILELWDDQRPGNAIRGFSLRHYDHEADRWVLYLNWPGPNRSGISSLTGRFRHGRGEFFSERQGADGTTTINRYTFCDITPTSLRWDDAYSKDGGKTWTHNWIMEFSRTAPTASWPGGDEPARTYRDGKRCDRPEFREFERLAGRWEGTLTAGATEQPASLVAYKVLDGCAVISFLEAGSGQERHLEFGFSSFNTYAERLEHARLDQRPGTGFEQLYGARDGDALVLQSRQSADPPRHRLSWRFDGEDRVTLVEGPAGGGEPTRTVTLRRVR